MPSSKSILAHFHHLQAGRLLLQLTAYPDAGAFMRRLDDATSQDAGGKPGNLYSHLCQKGNDAECAANLKMIKAWVVEGG